MYHILLNAHNGFRWLVLIALFISFSLSISGWLTKRQWAKPDHISSLVLVIVMDIQFLLGIVLYSFVSPVTKAAFADFGSAMNNSELRFYAVEHSLLMILALVLVHIGRAKSKKNVSSLKKFRMAGIYFSLALILILLAIPWNRALF